MAIQRQAENPGESLVLGEPIHYSLKTKKSKAASKPAPKAIPLHTVEATKKDLLYTAGVFVGILILLVALYFKMR